MNYRSKLKVKAWQVDFENAPPDWIAQELQHPLGLVALCGWADGTQWFDVYCAPEDLLAYAMQGDWIILDSFGNFSSLSDKSFSLLFEADEI